MSEQMELFRTLEKNLNFELAPCDRNFDLDTKSGLAKLELTPAQKGQISALFSQTSRRFIGNEQFNVLS